LIVWWRVKAAVTSRDDDVEPGKERGTEVFESGSDDHRGVGNDLQGAAAVLEQ
jgi:hypothetical protein